MDQQTNMTNIGNDHLSEQTQIPLLQDSNEYGYAFDANGKAVVIFEWSIVAIIVMVMLCLIRKRSQTNEMNLSRHPDAIQIEKERQEEEAKRKKTIIKLFQTEHIQQKITGDQIKNESCRTIETLSSEEDNASNDDFAFDEEEGYGTVVISPFPRVNSKAVLSSLGESDNCSKESDKTVEKSVTNMCAICLDEYHEGNTIVWSSNKNCSHAFHRDCLTNYLVKVKQQETYPCPCCRQNFFFDQDEETEKKTEEV
mmetsp:Transcript_16361/g.33711  ORF Transcript_16361/g.33711 Transcript_16361/m.33711 type:complete len:254 (-) Transcript_16361:79-840(-)